LLAIRCGVEAEDNDLTVDRDWPVLVARENPTIDSGTAWDCVRKPDSVHVFSSVSALHFLTKLLKNNPAAQTAAQDCLTAIGVGATTDAAVRGLNDACPELNVFVPTLSLNNKRDNGLHWTLEQLESRGLIPQKNLTLWTKSWSVSEKILKDFRHSRQWLQWNIATVEIYSLEASTSPIPTDIVAALLQQQPVCFSVKSGEVLDATVSALMKHLHKSSARELPASVYFSVWEKSALARAQQLFLQSRLIPANDFNALVTKTETNR
jgi:hypothetical protein